MPDLTISEAGSVQFPMVEQAAESSRPYSEFYWIRMHVHKERRWVIRNRVEYWAQRLGVHPWLVRVQHMNRKWGSCSTLGVITLAIDLADQEQGFRDFVIAHELLHLRVPNHGRLFKALLTVHVPDWKKYDVGKQSVAYVSKITSDGDHRPA